MYALKPAAQIAYNLLTKQLTKYRYKPNTFVSNILGAIIHATKCLCVDEFGVKYFSKVVINHLLSLLCKQYNVSCDWAGCNYCGLAFD